MWMFLGLYVANGLLTSKHLSCRQLDDYRLFLLDNGYYSSARMAPRTTWKVRKPSEVVKQITYRNAPLGVGKKRKLEACLSELSFSMHLEKTPRTANLSEARVHSKVVYVNAFRFRVVRTLILVCLPFHCRLKDELLSHLYERPVLCACMWHLLQSTRDESRQSYQAQYKKAL